MKNFIKLRLLYLYRYLVEHTDKDHTISPTELRERIFESYGETVVRNTIDADLRVLEESGLGIRHFRSSRNQYYFDAREFDTAELKLLVDAVASSKFISADESRKLIRKIATLATEYDAHELVRHVYAEDRVGVVNADAYRLIDTLNRAINEEKKISFLYSDFDAAGNRIVTNKGKPYTVSPYSLIWDGDYYYLRGFCDERAAMRNFRADRIYGEAEILEAEALPAPNDYDPATYRRGVFAMYEGARKPQKVTLYCEARVMKYIVDEFGSADELRARGLKLKPDPDMKHFTVRVEVSPGPTFYRWVFGFDGAIRILTPKPIKEQYRAMVMREADRLIEGI